MVPIFKIINFIIFLGLLCFFLRKPLREFFAARSKALNELISAAGKTFEKANAELERARDLLNSADDESANILRFAEEEALSDKQKLISSAKKYAEQIKTDASVFVKNETDKIVKEIKRTTAISIIDIVSKKIGLKRPPVEKAAKKIGAAV